MTDRIKKINELLRHELSSLIIREAELPPDCLVTVVDVSTSKDLRHANVYISVLPEDLATKAVKALYGSKLHKELYKKLSLKPLPRLHFKLDKTEEKASQIEELLDQIKEKG